MIHLVQNGLVGFSMVSLAMIFRSIVQRDPSPCFSYSYSKSRFPNQPQHWKDHCFDYFLFYFHLNFLILHNFALNYHCLPPKDFSSTLSFSIDSFIDFLMYSITKIVFTFYFYFHNEFFQVILALVNKWCHLHIIHCSYLCFLF